MTASANSSATARDDGEAVLNSIERNPDND
jgi:hypothetical protein